ncbi:DMT family transporter [Mangrovicoccus ximenensis]|uniref:DMT family transporter n=1 Tax=Mangrovicoccus ximenensis TaxID=1911570 RepID=UPI001374C390|nr:DMT family transporter [Mangrovicoccus ximenensis]
MTRIDFPKVHPYLAGTIFGSITVLIWSMYNIGSKIGMADGFRAADLVFLRFFGGGLVMLPVLWLARSAPAIPARRFLPLALLAGPAFAFVIASSFQASPLSHAVIITPCASMMTANLLVWLLDGDRPSQRRLCGMGLMVAGLALVGIDASSAPEELSGSTFLGDAGFATGGAMWGGYTYLVGRWKLPALQVASLITVISGAAVTPVYLLLADWPAVAASGWAEQVLYQGVGGGALAFAFFALTVSRLGAARASLFFAMVPPMAILMAIPMLHSIPSQLQVAAIALAVTGIGMSLKRPAAQGG